MGKNKYFLKRLHHKLEMATEKSKRNKEDNMVQDKSIHWARKKSIEKLKHLIRVNSNEFPKEIYEALRR